jgi:DNA (cytosine-5)-methyltransferase 1
MAAYYNEIEPYAVEWLRNLIAAGLIADGVVDDRSIKDVVPRDPANFFH